MYAGGEYINRSNQNSLSGKKMATVYMKEIRLRALEADGRKKVVLVKGWFWCLNQQMAWKREKKMDTEGIE